jgi:hypothetical protein
VPLEGDGTHVVAVSSDKRTPTTSHISIKLLGP